MRDAFNKREREKKLGIVCGVMSCALTGINDDKKKTFKKKPRNRKQCKFNLHVVIRVQFGCEKDVCVQFGFVQHDRQGNIFERDGYFTSAHLCWSVFKLSISKFEFLFLFVSEQNCDGGATTSDFCNPYICSCESQFMEFLQR